MTTHQAKKLLKGYLDANGLGYTKLTARTISFSDLARASCIFVKIHGYVASKPGISTDWADMKRFAVGNGFRIE